MGQDTILVGPDSKPETDFRSQSALLKAGALQNAILQPVFVWAERTRAAAPPTHRS
jgi:hypothetical protein